jgi:DNA primase large subunit
VPFFLSFFARFQLKKKNVLKVPFEEALDLVKNRAALVKGGFVFVSDEQLSSIISARFRAHLSESLAVAYKALGPLREKMDNVVPLLDFLSQKSVPSTYKVDSKTTLGRVDPGMLDMVFKKNKQIKQMIIPLF